MNTIDQIKAEIERLIKETNESQFDVGQRCAFYKILSFLDTLKEQPVEWSDEDEVMIRFYEADYDNKVGHLPMKEVVEMRLAFKNWLKNKLKLIRPQPNQEQPVCEGFSKEFDEYFLPKNREQKGRWGFADIFSLARHFAQWQREQMMKEAVEGRVVDAGIFATYNTPVEYTHSGDKVKIIIFKED